MNPRKSLSSPVPGPGGVRNACECVRACVRACVRWGEVAHASGEAQMERGGAGYMATKCWTRYFSFLIGS